jgi:hypothetical protein
MRDYTIDTLEKLCHFETTAVDAFKLIYRLANSEDELKKDAQISFVELFQMGIAETVLSLNMRLVILNEIEDHNDFSELLIQTYERMLKSHSFIGHMRPSNETFNRSYYYPNDPAEIKNYYTIAINKLKGIALAEDVVLSGKAKNALITRLSDQLYYGEPQLVLEAIKTIVDKEKVLSIPLRNKLLELSYNKRNLNSEIIQLINAILDNYPPENIEEELKALVTEAPWIHEYADTEEKINVSSKKAIDLAHRYIEENIEWITFLKLLLQGEQRQTFYFAEIMGKSDIDKNSVLDQIIEDYKLIPAKDQNTIFINGFIIGVNDEKFTRYAISKLISQPETEVHGIRQTRFIKPITITDLNILKPLLEKNPDYLKNLEYLDLLSFSNEEIIEVTSWIKDINFSFALQIFHEVLRKQDRWKELKEIVNEYLYTENILQSKSFINTSLHIEDLLKKSINDNPTDENIRFLSNQIVKSYDDLNTIDDSLLDRLTYFLLEEHWDSTWNYFGDYLADDNTRNYGLKMFLERYNFDNEKLFEWSKLDTEKYPAVAFQFMNIYIRNGQGDLEWEPFARKIIDIFGKQKKVLERLSSKLSNYSINTYSAESLYIKRKRFIEELIDHPFEELRIFVKKEIEYLDFRIIEERKSGENYELRNNEF